MLFAWNRTLSILFASTAEKIILAQERLLGVVAVDSDPHAALDRLAAAFGAEPVRDLTERFAAMLDEALLLLVDGRGAVIAHRVAGLAGTLGFAAASRAWLALVEGDGNAGGAATQESRRALVTIAHWRAVKSQTSA
jgi:hypothetical protein